MCQKAFLTNLRKGNRFDILLASNNSTSETWRPINSSVDHLQNLIEAKYTVFCMQVYTCACVHVLACACVCVEGEEGMELEG